MAVQKQNRRKIGKYRKLLSVITLIAAIRRRHRVTRSCWVRDWIGRREILGMSASLVNELMTEDTEEFRSMFRMDVTTFENLLALVTPHISEIQQA